MKKLFVLIGPSGAGKTTYTYNARQSGTIDSNARVFSLDALRHEWYDPEDYANAWKMACDDKSFSARANTRFEEMISSDADIVVDNVNATAKSRSFYVSKAKKRGFRVIAVNFHTPLDVMISRQSTRSDKCVPVEAVIRQHSSLVFGEVGGEFDEVCHIYHMIKP